MILLLLACADRDGDGVSALLGDCEDDNPTVHPGAEELCNGFDDDCDGNIDGHDATGSGWLDADGDGYGSEWLCEPSLDLVSAGGDCNDGDPLVSPGAAEVCNAVDDDCDGVVDDGTPLMTWWVDTDGDGYGVFLGDTVQACEQPVGYAGNDADCDDAVHDINPSNVWFLDFDRDGSGDPAEGVETCHPLPGYVDNDLDCDDTRPDVHPEGQEVCDAADADEDCDGLVEDDDATATDLLAWFEDLDEDGLGNHAESLMQCEQPSGYVANSSDCDDDDSQVGEESCGIVTIEGSSGGPPCVHYGDGRAYCFSSGWLDQGSALASVKGARRGLCAARSDGTSTCSSLDESDYIHVTGPAEHTQRAIWAGVRGDGTVHCVESSTYDGYDGYCPTGGGWTRVAGMRMTICAEDSSGYVECFGYSNTEFAGKQVVDWDARQSGSCAVLQSGEITCAPSGTFGVAVGCGQFSDGRGGCCWVADDGTLGCDGSINGTPPAGSDFVVVGTDGDWICGGTHWGQLICNFDVGSGFAPIGD